MSLELYNYLSFYGDVVPTRHKMKNPDDFVSWTEKNFTYVRYNPRKNIDRYGLSITSLHGNLDGNPDLDSLLEYNKENKTSYRESDFVTKTPVYYYDELKQILDPIEKYLFRSHVLKINPGGFFPNHRDFYGMKVDSFRILIPLVGCNPPNFIFTIDDKTIHWNHGQMYFVNTAKMHYLFNASFDPTYMLVLNVALNIETIEFVTKNLASQ
jgi:hypothetical protein